MTPRFNTPLRTMEPQLRTMKTQPTTTLESRRAGTALFPLALNHRANPRPQPTSRLNSGPAKHAVSAMLLSPLLAMAMLVERSPMELPHASTVRPSTALLTPDRRPKNCNIATNSCATKAIQVAATIKPAVHINAAPMRMRQPQFHSGGTSLEDVSPANTASPSATESVAAHRTGGMCQQPSVYAIHTGQRVMETRSQARL
mmetsp:Transcript_22721/g.40486  ORF Transcript_22721/g.40486 Transcript_22721/m.40486 type:complete len:201 (-) Transcript_22721:1899-2501(-)